MKEVGNITGRSVIEVQMDSGMIRKLCFDYSVTNNIFSQIAWFEEVINEKKIYLRRAVSVYRHFKLDQTTTT